MDLVKVDPVAFQACPEDSVDYAVLVAHKEKIQGVKKLVEQLEKDFLNEHFNQREV